MSTFVPLESPLPSKRPLKSQHASGGARSQPSAAGAFLCIPAVGMQQVLWMSKRCVMCEYEQSMHMLLASGGARLTPQGAPKHRRCAGSPYPSKRPGSALPEVLPIPRMDSRMLVDAGAFLCAQRCTERQFIGVLNKGRGSRSKLRGGHWREFSQAFHRGTLAIQRRGIEPRRTKERLGAAWADRQLPLRWRRSRKKAYTGECLRDL